ncbi:hypothetical protein RSOL_052980, partial [Rhizoctonia solani AG-3 Rhs1AP]
MSAQTTAAASVQTLTPSDNPTRFSEVLATIARTQKMMILCGENVCLAEGLLPVGAPLSGQRAGQGVPNTLRGLLVECSPTTIPAEQLPADKLAALNLVMTRRRIAARSAPLTTFHDLLGQLFDQDRLVSCVTGSFDGVEERCRPGFSDRLVMLYGDNRQLRCYTKTSKERRKGTDATRALRPTVQFSLGAEMLIGEDRQEMKKTAEACQLLLIIGLSLKDTDILDLTRELGEVIRSKYGGVVYVNPLPLRGGQSTHDHIDFHLKVEPGVVVDGILSFLGEPNSESMLVDGEDHTADMWFDFWPVTKQLCAALSGRWKNNGWPCHIVTIKLETLDEQPNTLNNLAWEEQSFDVMAIYLTHGLSGEQGYQVGHQQTHRGAQLFDSTLKGWQALLNKARSKRAFLLCCGHPLRSPQLVREMQLWIDSSGALDSITGCLNQRLSPGFMVNVMCKMSTRLVEESEWMWEIMYEVWLTDSIARTHSDLLCIAPGRPAEMWLYAPFQSRPLGKPLPDLLQVCNCPKLVGGSADTPTGLAPRKQWKVTHQGKGGQPIREISVKATCSRCKQFWKLPSAGMVGDLKNMGGQYGVRVPYFVSE